MPCERNALPRAAFSDGVAAVPAAVEPQRTARTVVTTSARTCFTTDCVAQPADGGGGKLAVDGDRDGAPAPLTGLCRRGEPEVDDPALDRVADIGSEPGPVPGHVQLRAERDELRVD